MVAEDEGEAATRQSGAPVSYEFLEFRPESLSARCDRIAVAIHEAGHAVVGYFVGHAIPPHLHVWIEEDSGATSGTAQGRGGDLWQCAVTAMAGHAAVEVLAPDLAWYSSLPSEPELRRLLAAFRGNDLDAIGDADEAAALACLIDLAPGATDDELLAGFKVIVAQATQIVRMPQIEKLIEAVMIALLRYSRISGAQVERIICDQTPA